MKVIIVEKSPLNIGKIKQILQVNFPFIEIENILSDLSFLSSIKEYTNQPPFVLINLIQSEYLLESEMQARFVLEVPDHQMTYLAVPLHQLALSISSSKGVGLENRSMPSIDIEDEALMVNSYSENRSELTAYKERFLVEQGKRIFSIPIEDIAYFFSDQRLIYFVTRKNQKYATSYRIEELEQILDPELFFRVNRSYIISIVAIGQIASFSGGRYKINLVPSTEEEVFVSRSRFRNFQIWLGA